MSETFSLSFLPLLAVLLIKEGFVMYLKSLYKKFVLLVCFSLLTACSGESAESVIPLPAPDEVSAYVNEYVGNFLRDSGASFGSTDFSVDEQGKITGDFYSHGETLENLVEGQIGADGNYRFVARDSSATVTVIGQMSIRESDNEPAMSGTWTGPNNLILSSIGSVLGTRLR